MLKPLFSVNTYDRDGDIVESCVLLHIDNRTTLTFKSSVELEQFAVSILGMLPEIRDTEY